MAIKAEIPRVEIGRRLCIMAELVAGHHIPAVKPLRRATLHTSVAIAVDAGHDSRRSHAASSPASNVPAPLLMAMRIVEDGSILWQEGAHATLDMA